MANSSIEWTDSTWNPVSGCTRASAGCDFCYAVPMTRRLAAMGQEKYTGLVNAGKGHFNGVTKTHPDALDQPLRAQKGRVYFVNSMSDLFHPGVPFSFVEAVFGVMAATPHHTFQVLTKRPERAAEFFAQLGDDPLATCTAAVTRETNGALSVDAAPVSWPLENVWIGTSVEDDRVADRIDALREVPAHVRFLSCEPLIGPLDLRGKLDDIDWAIVGGESGPKARPMKAEWAGAIMAACADAGVAYFFKQTGRVLARELGIGDKKGSDSDTWPPEVVAIGAREYPEATGLAA